jgi:hypothetical protein
MGFCVVGFLGRLDRADFYIGKSDQLNFTSYSNSNLINLLVNPVDPLVNLVNTLINFVNLRFQSGSPRTIQGLAFDESVCHNLQVGQVRENPSQRNTKSRETPSRERNSKSEKPQGRGNSLSPTYSTCLASCSYLPDLKRFHCLMKERRTIEEPLHAQWI